jgi:hypothetical protein
VFCHPPRCQQDARIVLGFEADHLCPLRIEFGDDGVFPRQEVAIAVGEPVAVGHGEALGEEHLRTATT